MDNVGDRSENLGITSDAEFDDDARYHSVGPPPKKSQPGREDEVAMGQEVKGDGGGEGVTIDILPPDLLTMVMSYVDPGRHRYVAGTSRRLREAYMVAHPSIDRRQTTYWSAAAESSTCASLCLREAPEYQPGGCDPVRRIGEAAARWTGRLDVIQWLEREHAFDANELLEDLRKNRSTDSRTWALFCRYVKQLQANKNVARLVLDCAALGGHMHIVRHYAERGCYFDNWTASFAAQSGHIEILQYLVEQKMVLSFEEDLPCPFEEVGVHPEVSDACCMEAASGGQLEVLQYLHGLGLVFDDPVMKIACRKGQLEVVKFLNTINPVGSHTADDEIRSASQAKFVDVAVRHGHLHVIEYFYNQGFPLTQWCYELAAERGLLQVLEYLHSKNVPWGPMVCLQAASAGQLDALKFLINKGCPFNEEEITAALGTSEITEWIRNRGNHD